MNLLKRYNKIINIFYNKINNNELLELDVFNQIKNNKIILYKPIEFVGFLIPLDLSFPMNPLNILIDSNYISFVEYIKYQREINDVFFIAEYITTLIKPFQLKYLQKIAKIKIISNFEDHYDVVLISDIFKVKYYLNNKYIVLICPVSEQLINQLSFYQDKFKFIDIISPTILSNNGDIIILFYNNDDFQLHNNYSTIEKHLKKLIQMYKYKYFIYKSKFDFISVFKKKILFKTYKTLHQFDIPVKPKIESFYNKKLIKITNKFYTVLNPIKYQIIPLEDDSLSLCYKISHFTNFKDISIYLNKIKRAIDVIDKNRWYKITFETDNYKQLGYYVSSNYNVLINPKFKVSNAFLKIYEILMTFDFFINKQNIKTFHFCESPGMFIIGLNHYLQTKTNINNWYWFANSITEKGNVHAVPDRFGFIAKYPDNWLFGPKDGDITKIETINFFKQKLNEVDFISSDCGICIENESPNMYEELIALIDFAQFLNTLHLLKIGGSCVLKTFIPMEKASNISIVYSMSKLFEQVYIYKPITSRAHNSEIYLIGLNYLYYNKKLIDHMIDILINNKFNPDIQWIDNIPDSFIKQFEDYIVDITRQQISYLLNIFYFIDSHKEYKNLFDKKDILFKNWCSTYKFISNNNNKLI